MGFFSPTIPKLQAVESEEWLRATLAEIGRPENARWLERHDPQTSAFVADVATRVALGELTSASPKQVEWLQRALVSCRERHTDRRPATKTEYHWLERLAVPEMLACVERLAGKAGEFVRDMQARRLRDGKLALTDRQGRYLRKIAKEFLR